LHILGKIDVPGRNRPGESDLERCRREHEHRFIIDVSTAKHPSLRLCVPQKQLRMGFGEIRQGFCKIRQGFCRKRANNGKKRLFFLCKEKRKELRNRTQNWREGLLKSPHFQHPLFFKFLIISKYEGYEGL
jgi:hypothetical protein